MKKNTFERIVFLILSAFLLFGAIHLALQKESRTGIITIEKDGIRESLTLKDAEKFLSEERKVSLNDASDKELENVPGIGPKLAGDILSYKKEHGPFGSIDGVKNVRGIGEKKFEKIKNYIKIK